MKKIIVELFVISLIAVMAYYFLKPLFIGNSQKLSVRVEEPIVFLDKIHESEKYFIGKIDSLKRVNADLNQNIIKTRSSLTAVKVENASLRQSIDDLLSVHYTETDTSAIISNCDSLAVAFVNFKAIDQLKDSLYDSMVIDLQSQVSIKDSMISLQKDECDTLRNNLTSIAYQHQQLLTENTQQREMIKKHRKGKRLLGGILAVITGVLVVVAIH
ncbi:hypothetical protein [Chitinophaga sp. LS1]|uniref:hypothetical protein n=1 Tax=Chitinophaga sp. LS1 TaxID=3051176 RepID=UPI002AAAA451|nr:hypothetical protein [Chitinophaga sp. LS1]WPV70594.1 hypothetical protein QQL36_17940 [Chitinophaga sp. LS1]